MVKRRDSADWWCEKRWLVIWLVEDAFVGGSFEGRFGAAKWQLGDGRVNFGDNAKTFARNLVAVGAHNSIATFENSHPYRSYYISLYAE